MHRRGKGNKAKGLKKGGELDAVVWNDLLKVTTRESKGAKLEGTAGEHINCRSKKTIDTLEKEKRRLKPAAQRIKQK